MPIDGLLISNVVKLLKPIEGARIGKIHNLSEEEILFQLHGKQCGTKRLAISVHSNTARIYFTNSGTDFQPVPTSFVMILRKKISQGIITKVEQADLDRIVILTIQGVNEFQDRTEYRLYIELMGKYANLILTEEPSHLIIDCLKRIPVFENSKRLIHPGALYALPDKPVKKNPYHAGAIDLGKSLVSQFEGFSPQLSREFLLRMQEGETFEELMQMIDHSEQLYVYPKDFHLIPLKTQPDQPQVYPLMEGLDQLFRQDEMKTRIQQQCGDVFKTVDRELKRLKKKLPKLQDSLENSERYDQYREYGDLLFAYQYQIEKQPVIVLPSFETGEDIQIPIDMRFDLKDNANQFYKKYHKLKRGVQMLSEQIEKVEDEILYFQQLQEQLQHCQADDALEIREELIKGKYMRARQSYATRRKKKKNPHVLHLRYEDADIYVGKNNLQNQYITFQISNRSDLWFHVKDYHGSHVLLKTTDPTEEQIRLCASLAAYFSKGKNSSSVPVDYTTISMLKKVPKKAAGFVTMKSYKTIYIDPDQEQIESMIKEHQVQ